ncbi:hypothetical protein FA95DRAFT_1490597, partial [Auriscalpium vulgare]
RVSETIYDKQDRALVQMAGRPPSDKSWPGEAKSVSKLFSDIGGKCDFNDGQLLHTRGQYPIMRAGFTFGGGPKVCAWIYQKRRTSEIFCPLISDVALTYPAAPGALSLHRLKLYMHVDDVVAGAMAQDASLTKAFEGSVFPTATFNFGPQALTKPHRDDKNIPYGWCTITALGDFDYKKGGHLILWELKLIIEFPPGSTILIPSAILTHSNTPIQEGETRQSFTQYCAGDLVRWQAYGYRTEERLCDEDPELRSRLVAELPGRWKRAVEMFSTKGKELQGDLQGLRK